MEGIQFQDSLAVNAITLEWADSIDKKDWARFRSILAPTLLIYSVMGQPCFPDMKAEEFTAMLSAPTHAGHPLVHAQHLLGGAKYEKVSDSEIVAVHQILAAHQHYVDIDQSIVAYHGHNHGTVKHRYKKNNGVWKLAGVQPESYWLEHDFDKIFAP